MLHPPLPRVVSAQRGLAHEESANVSKFGVFNINPNPRIKNKFQNAR